MLTAGSRLGPCEILSALGAGGMGEVYKARDPRLNRLIAIKLLPAAAAADPERRDRFEREARATKWQGTKHEFAGAFNTSQPSAVRKRLK